MFHFVMQIRSDRGIGFAFFTAEAVETEEVAVFGLEDVFFCFVAEGGAHVGERVACLECSRKGFGGWFTGVAMPESVVRKKSSEGRYLADFRRNHAITGEGRRSVRDRMTLSKRSNVRDRINAT